MARQLHAEDAAFWRTCKVGCWLTVIVRGEVHTINRKDMGSLSQLSQCLLACDFWSLAADTRTIFISQRIGWDGTALKIGSTILLWQWMCFRCSPIFPVYFPNGVFELQHCRWISKARSLQVGPIGLFHAFLRSTWASAIYSGRWNV